MEKLVVIGAGESGKGAAYLAKKNGWSVFVTDSGKIAEETKSFLDANEIPWEEEQHSEEKVMKADCVVKSPGVPGSIPLIMDLINNNVPILSEIEFAYQYTDAKIVGITGSNGKTTTTSLTYALLKHSGLNVQMAGNVGNSFAMDVADEKRDLYVLELSSFQLDDIVDFKPDVSVLLNLSPDHLNRYDNDYQQYIESKFQIIRNQTEEDYFIYCLDDQDLMENIPNHSIKAQMIPFTQNKEVETGAYLADDTIIINVKKKPLKCLLKN